MAEAVRRRVILTGAPGTGKTTMLTALGARFPIVDEPARRIIAEHRAVTGDENLDAVPDVMVERMTARMLSDFVAAGTGTTIFDRGLPDCVAYLAAYGLDTGAAFDTARRHEYEGPVFVFPPWEEIYTTDDMRKATFVDVTMFHRLLVDAYTSLEYELVEVPRVPVVERVAWISDRIG